MVDTKMRIKLYIREIRKINKRILDKLIRVLYKYSKIIYFNYKLYINKI